VRGEVKLSRKIGLKKISRQSKDYQDEKKNTKKPKPKLYPHEKEQQSLIQGES